MQTVAFCERDLFCRKVLRKHWPVVPIYDDVAEVSIDRLECDGIGRPDLVCGGFPCQPFSNASAGKRKGQDDHRYLWPEMLRIIEETRPSWVLAENVTGFIRMGLEQVVSDLEARGYPCWSFVIPACAIGQNHRRDRVWSLAHADSDRQPGSAIDAETPVVSAWRCEPGGMGRKDGVSNRMDRNRLKALGNAVVPQIPEIIGRAIVQCSRSF